MAIQRGRKGGRRKRPKPGDVNVVPEAFKSPRPVQFDPHEVAKIQLWIDRMAAQFEFKIDEYTVDQPSESVSKWRDGQVHYWKSAIKFMKWMSYTIGRQHAGDDPGSGA